MSNDNLTPDDFVQADEFEEQFGELEDAVESLRDDVEHADGAGLEPADIDRTVEEKTRAMLEHLAHDDCDTDACQELRDTFGIDPADGAEGGAGGGADDEGDTDQPAGGGHDDGGSGADGGDGDEGESGSDWPPETW